MASIAIGVAVIGCGSTAHRRHLPAWQQLPGARLVAVVSRDAERRRSAAQRYGADHAIADWQTLLQTPEVEAVDICVPHRHHAEIAIAMARAGKHVLCEKPFATTLPDGMAMVEAAARSGVVLLPFHNMRLGGVAAQGLAIAASGAIGEPLLLRGVMGHGGPDASDPARRWFLEPSAGGGAVLDLGPHLFDLTAALMPVRANRLRATLRAEPGAGVERDGLVEVAYPGGAMAQMTLSWSHVAGRETSVVVQGTAGVLRVCLLQSPDPAPGAPAAPLILAQARASGFETSYPAPLPGDEPCALFLRAIRGETVALAPDDGLETVRYIDAAYRSHADGGAWVGLGRT